MYNVVRDKATLIYKSRRIFEEAFRRYQMDKRLKESVMLRTVNRILPGILGEHASHKECSCGRFPIRPCRHNCERYS